MLYINYINQYNGKKWLKNSATSWAVNSLHRDSVGILGKYHVFLVTWFCVNQHLWLLYCCLRNNVLHEANYNSLSKSWCSEKCNPNKWWINCNHYKLHSVSFALCILCKPNHKELINEDFMAQCIYLAKYSLFRNAQLNKPWLRILYESSQTARIFSPIYLLKGWLPRTPQSR